MKLQVHKGTWQGHVSFGSYTLPKYAPQIKQVHNPIIWTFEYVA